MTAPALTPFGADAVAPEALAEIQRAARPGRVPMRQEPRTPDGDDARRIDLVRRRWRSWDAVVQQRDRTVEEIIRMLSGRQWDVWSEMQGKFIDPLAVLDERERLWRARPVIDFLRYGFQINLAKLTESPPVIAFEPASADQADAELAAAADTICKTVAATADMEGVRARYLGWALATGQAYLKSRIDYTRGDEVALEGPATLTAPDGSEVEIDEAVPYGEDGSPLAELQAIAPCPGCGCTDPACETCRDEECACLASQSCQCGSAGAAWGYTVPEGAEPHRQREGEIVVEEIPAACIRSEAIPGPIERKRWVIHRSYLPVEEIDTRWPGEGDAALASGNAGGSDARLGDPGIIRRLLHSAGFFGSATPNESLTGSATPSSTVEGDKMVCVDEMWERPCPEYPEGRLLIVTETRVLYDGPRPFPKLRGAGPFREVNCLEIPGRPFPGTPFEMAVMLQKALNRAHAYILEHGAKSANGLTLIHAQSGIEPGAITNQPGAKYEHNSPPGVIPIQIVPPAPLSPDFWEEMKELKQHLLMLLSIPGSEGKAPTANASGDLVEQLRYNADRAVAALAHSCVRAETGLAEDWLAMLGAIWTRDKMLSVAGDDSVVRTITVLPDLFETGKVNVRPVLEALQSGSLPERRRDIKEMFRSGDFGDPADPTVRGYYLKLMRYPHMDAVRPGGPDRVTAERNLGKLARGTSADEVAATMRFQMNFGVHLQVTRDFIASPDYEELDEAVQDAMQTHYFRIQQAMIQQQMMQQQMANAAQMAVAPPPPALGPGSPGGPDAPAPDGASPAGPSAQPFGPASSSAPPLAGNVAAANAQRANAGGGAAPTP